MKTIDVVLKNTVHLKPHQRKIVEGTVKEDTVAIPGVFMILPNEEVLAEKKCDVLQTAMEGSSTKVDLPLSNWGNSQIVMKKGGALEEVTRIDKDDEIQKDHSQEKVIVCQTTGATEKRRQELCRRLYATRIKGER